MKSRRQSSGGSASAAAAAAAAAAAGEGNNTSCGGGGCKMERKDVEKNRRLHMKGLCLKLSSLIPAAARNHHHLHYSDSSPPSNKDTVTQLDHLDNAAAYIKQLKERIDELKQKKEGGAHVSSSSSSHKAKTAAGVGGAVSINMPVIEVRYQDATLDVVLISQVGKPFKLHEVITVLEQEGAEVVNASFSVISDKIFYTIHSQALSSRIGLEASRVSQRLQDLLA